MEEIEKKEIDDLRGSDLSAAMIAEASKPKKTWFFERMGDGMIFACEEREAWEVCYNKSTWKRRDFRLLGTSDGTTYQRVAKEAKDRVKSITPLIEKKKAELQKYMRAEERLLIDEAIDMEGPEDDIENQKGKQKVLRLQAIMERLHDELDKLEAEYKELSKDIIKKATDAEFEVAKKNQQERITAGLGPDWPDPDGNIITPDAKDRNKIIGIMHGRPR